MPQIYLIGIGMGNPDTLTVRAQRIIGQSDCLIGAKRMLESVENDRAVRISSIKNEEIVSAILQQPQDSIISVLLSGDVGFYSAAAGTLFSLPWTLITLRSSHEVSIFAQKYCRELIPQISSSFAPATD